MLALIYFFWFYYDNRYYLVRYIYMATVILLYKNTVDSAILHYLIRFRKDFRSSDILVNVLGYLSYIVGILMVYFDISRSLIWTFSPLPFLVIKTMTRNGKRKLTYCNGGQWNTLYRKRTEGKYGKIMRKFVTYISWKLI